jgi:hypothetical protein
MATMDTSTGVAHVDNVTNVTVFIDGSAIGGPIVVAASPVVSVYPLQCNFNFQTSAGGMTFEIVPTGLGHLLLSQKPSSTDHPPKHKHLLVAIHRVWGALGLSRQTLD